MGREFKADAGETFRVLADTKDYLGNSAPTAHGPFGNLATAKAAANRSCVFDYTGYRKRDPQIPHKIQRSALVWEDVA